MKNSQLGIALFLCTLGGALLTACSSSRPTPSKPGMPLPGRPGAERPKNEPMDTIRWSTPPQAKPPIGNDKRQEDSSPRPGQTYQIGLLLPFLSNQFDGSTVPEKSRLAVQFYGGAKLALQQLSTDDHMNLVVDVYDTQAADADFQTVMNGSRFDKPQVYIGPIRGSHVELLAARTKLNHKILLSPESPNEDLTTQNPGFLQTNPSLKTHCEAITRFVRRTHRPEEVVLVCKQKEASRLDFFQQTNQQLGGGKFAEVIVPDAAVNFDNTNLASYLKAGRTTVFILPSWSNQDFVMAFLRKLRAVKGSARVEVYGMPQWLNYENIEPEFFSALDVHVSSAAYIDYGAPDVQAFQQAFYDAYGTLPDDDAFNGYDVTLFTGKMLRKYGLSFPEKLAREQYTGLRSRFQFSPYFQSATPADSRPGACDYLENKFVFILKFENGRFVPATD